jgi:hypothetical protein
LSPEDQILYDKFNGRCAFCSTKLTDDLSFDVVHSMPACIACAVAIGDMSVEEYRQKIANTLENFRRVLGHSFLTEDIKPILFYFERFR